MNSNLRQLAQEEMAQRGWPACRCIRCREVHRRAAEGRPAEAYRLRLVRRDYEAGGGSECFLSFEDPDADALAAFLRLRHVRASHRTELCAPGGVAAVRELKVYGTAQALGAHDDPDRGAWQHHGLGARLVAQAERIAATEWGVGRVVVLAGPGVKAYYRRLGYGDLGPYLAKECVA